MRWGTSARACNSVQLPRRRFQNSCVLQPRRDDFRTSVLTSGSLRKAFLHEVGEEDPQAGLTCPSFSYPSLSFPMPNLAASQMADLWGLIPRAVTIIFLPATKA